MRAGCMIMPPVARRRKPHYRPFTQLDFAGSIRDTMYIA
jgi:hypothetical protein